MRVALYSALYGRYEHPKRIPADLGIPAIMFTDQEETAAEAEAAGWQPFVVKHHYESPNGDPSIVVPMLNHKVWKTHPSLALPDTDISIWIDGSMEIVVPNFMELCLTALGEDDWACMPHPARTCIYPEADYSATLTWRYDAPSLHAQARFYSGFHPANWGLIATGFNVRRHTEDVIQLGREWWTEILRYNHQDQISLPVLMKLFSDAGRVRFNYNLPWHQYLRHFEHGA